MDRQFDCPHCRQPVLIRGASAGQEFACPHCGGNFVCGRRAWSDSPSLLDTLPPLDAANPASPGIRRSHDLSRRRLQSLKKSSAAELNGKLLIAACIAAATAAVPPFLFAGIRLLSAASDRQVAMASDALEAGEAVRKDSFDKQQPSSAAAEEKTAAATPAPKVSSPPPAKQALTGKAPSAASLLPPPSPVPQPAEPKIVAPPQAIEDTAPVVTQTSPAAISATPAVSATPATDQPATDQPATSAPPADTALLVQKIEPSVVVVQVELEKGSAFGSGFPLDDRGTIATNYHVIEGAKSAKIKFGDKTADVEGFLVYAPGKDIAILRARLGTEKLTPLKLAAAKPTKGETVLTFGAPLGFDSTVSNGIVSATRSGTELREIFKKLTGSDSYVEQQRYDLDAAWIQTTAPISGGNSGGPLVNLRGEVVGLNTWALVVGQNMNFAISAQHLQGMLASTQSGVHPFSELPAPREPAAVAAKGDRTLEYWNDVSRISRTLADRIAKIRPVPIPSSPDRLKAVLPKLAGIYTRIGELLPGAASELKALKIDDVDPELVALVTVDALWLDKLGENARKTAVDINLMKAKRIALFDQKNLAKKSYGDFEGIQVGAAYDLVRIKLTNRYGLTFPSLFDERPARGG